MKRIILILGIIIIFSGILYALYMYNKPHKNVLKQKADFETSADIILGDFLTDPNEANLKYSGKIIIVDGKLTSNIPDNSEINSILLNSEKATLNCMLDSTQVTELHGFDKGDLITIKGIFVGYDDLLEELQFNNCYIIKN
jgi:hypothetical protein